MFLETSVGSGVSGYSVDKIYSHWVTCLWDLVLLSWKIDTNNINKKKNVAVLFSCIHHVEAVEEAVVLLRPLDRLARSKPFILCETLNPDRLCCKMMAF